MKILFLSINTIGIPNFETELELMTNHLEKGDEVFVLRNQGSLKRSYSNPNNFRSVFFSSTLRFNIGIKRVGVPQKNIFDLKNRIDYKDLPEKFKNLKELKAFEAYGVNIGFGVVSYLISELKDHDFNTVLYEDKIRKTLEASILVFESVYELLQKLRIDVLYVFNGRFFDAWPSVQACRKLNITFYAYEFAINDVNKYVLYKNSLPHDLQRIKPTIETFWNDSSNTDKKRLGKSFFEELRGRVARGRNISFVTTQKKNSLPENFDKAKTNIVFFNGTMDEYEAFEEFNNPIYEDEFHALKSILESFKGRGNIQFYLRVHPNLKGYNNSQIQSLKKLDLLGYGNLKIIWPEDKVDSYALLDNCDKVFSFVSTMGLEACFWGKPSILLGRSFYEDLGCCYIPKSHEEVVKLIDSKLESKSKEDAIKYGYWMLEFGISYKYYKPTGRVAGAFNGRELWDDVTLKDRLKLKFLILKDLGFKKAFIWQLTKLKRYVASKRENWFGSR